jgi:hypothetical protein
MPLEIVLRGGLNKPCSRPKRLSEKHASACAGREPRGPGQRPGGEADVRCALRSSARLRRSPRSAGAGGVKGGPQAERSGP